MEMSKHGLHRATVYAKPDKATATYVRMMDVESYVNKLLVNEALCSKILKNYTSLVRTLSHPACEIIKQLQFDVHLIEVSNGFFFRISTRPQCDPGGQDWNSFAKSIRTVRQYYGTSTRLL